jgi:polygalacturonase
MLFPKLSMVIAFLTSALTVNAVELEPIAPIKAPFDMPQMQRPAIPAREFSIRDYGAVEAAEANIPTLTASSSNAAVADANAKNSAAIKSAIAACSAAGGGRVIIPAGRWHAGPIHLRSNINLHISDRAEIIFSDCIEDYLPVVPVRVGGIELLNYSPLIYAKDCENIAITGAGKLNGNARVWWPWKTRETREIFQLQSRGIPPETRIYGNHDAAIRPSFVTFYNCKNILMEGFTIGSGPNWTIHPVYCENIIIRRVHVLTDGPNNDGIDPDSCRNMLIEHCVFDTGDDCVVLKSGYNEDGWRVNRPCENVVMRHCSSKRGHGGLVIGSEMSGGVRNVYMHDCYFEGTDRAVRIKSRIDRGGVVENIWAENLKVKNMKYEVAILNMDYSADRNTTLRPAPPVFRNIHLKNITADGAPVAIRITGLESHPDAIHDITFENMEIKSTQGVISKFAKNLSFKDVKIIVSKGQPYELCSSKNILIDGKRVNLETP